MSITLIIPTTLRNYIGKQTEIQLDGSNVKEILEDLLSQFPDARKIIEDDNGNVRPFLNFFVNSTNIKQLNGLETSLKEGDQIYLVPSIAGGSGVNDDNPGIHKETPTEKREPVIKTIDGVSLDNDEILRYSRHLLLKEIGVKGQKRLKSAKVLIAGLGGLGAPLAQYLAAAGVGTIGLADFDEVDATNLQRQVIHGTRDIGRPKVASARDSIRAINPKVKVNIHQTQLTSENILEIIKDYDIVADATDNYVSRYLISDACVLAGKPDVFGAVLQFEGQVTVFDPNNGPCYRCVYPSPPPAGLVPTCSLGGILGVLVGIIGSCQAAEVIKLIVGTGDALIGKLLVIDAWHWKFTVLDIAKDHACPICGDNQTITDVQEVDYQELCGLVTHEKEEEQVTGIAAKDLKARLDRGDKINLVDVREPHERAIVKFPGAVVIPIGQLARRQNELNSENDTVFICKEGKRSILAINTLKEAGYKGKCFNLINGINEWARTIDTSMAVY